MRKIFTIIAIIVLFAACKTPGNGIFSRGTPYEQYSRRISDAGLSPTALGAAWIAAGEKSLSKPVTINLPFKEKGYFDKAEPAGLGFRFRARRGQVINLSITKRPRSGFTVFSELWHLADSAGANRQLLQSVDTTLITHEIKTDGYYLMRIQPELLVNGEYDCEIFVTPGLAFPVSTKEKTRVGSFWGDARDAGARNHEGIDIFGQLHSPVIAAADATVSRVGINNLGGKVIFLRPNGKDYSLYYAHLDSQLVQTGDRVLQGQLIGLMGKTGNAKNTPVHLHFGIYTSIGAVDPLPFVKSESRISTDKLRGEELLNEVMVNSKKLNVLQSPAAESKEQYVAHSLTLMKITGVTDRFFRVRLPDDKEGYVEAGALGKLSVKEKIITKSIRVIRDRPFDDGFFKKEIPAGTALNVHAFYNNYYYVRVGATVGWIKAQN